MTATAYTQEVIRYGGLPLRRADVYAIVIRDLGDKRAADLFAFGPNARRTNEEPMTIAQFDEVTA